MKTELTKEHVQLLAQIENGADILAPSEAKLLREVEAFNPKLLDICQPMGNYGVMEKLPYFGAITTKEGMKFVHKFHKENNLITIID